MDARVSGSELADVQIAVGVLGPVAALRDGTPIDLGGPRQRALLAALAAAYPHSVSADQLLAEVWNDVPDPTVNALHFAVSKLRRHLDPQRSRGQGGPVVRSGPHYALRIAELDSARFDALIRTAHEVRTARTPTATDDAAAILNEALGLWRGEPFQDVGHLACVAPERTRLDGLYRDASSALIEVDLARGCTREALNAAESLVDRYPLDEHAWELLALSMYRRGRQADALAAIRRVRRALMDELGVDPGIALQALEQRILTHEVAQRPPDEPPPPVLPAFRTRLIGRTADLATVSDLLERHALVTLFGPGGVGKTRLALEVARSPRTGDDTWFVDLAGVAEGSPIAAPVAEALGLPGVETAEELAALIARRGMFVILDNCEHLVVAAAHLVAVILERCPHVRILATSRELLDVDSEVGYEIRPLDLAFAVELFADRAVRFDPGWSLERADSTSVHRICEGLDGLPLALELAAAQLCVLSESQIADGLADRFTMLTTGPRFAGARQRRLVDTVDWSYRMLDAPSSWALRALSVFAGSFDIHGAAAVLGVDDPIRAVDTVRVLVRRSLLSVVPDTTPRRYVMLRTIKHFAAQQRTPVEEIRIVAAYLTRVLRRAVALAAELRGPGARDAVSELAADRAEHRAALTTALEHGDLHYVLELSGALYWFWYRKANVSEGLGFLRVAIERVDQHPIAPKPEHLGRALMGMALLTDLTGDSETAQRHSDRAREVLLGTGDVADIAYADSLRAYYRTVCGDHDGAVDIVQRSLIDARRLGIDWIEASLLMVMGIAQRGSGDLEAAPTLRKSVEVGRRCGYQWVPICSLWALAKIAADSRDHAEGLELAREILPILEFDSEVTGWIVTMHTAAAALAQAGRTADAARVSGAARAHGERVGVQVELLDPYSAEEDAAMTAASRTDNFDAYCDEGAGLTREEANALLTDSRPPL
ncbi:BTAD domain-containing putative transcriptional regulator [Rhodococcus sp. NPDC060086]|uniref:BTAD domain-containing putative transcriptional regulator n=1 Tax=Rhodococcus sp. NPDC060086 TaxID=3347055 RepID=UPI003660B1EB